MSAPVTELSLRWKRDPDAANTVALANAVRGPLYATLIQEVGAFATHKLGSDLTVLLAVARMYMSAQLHADAQTLLVTAGRVAPREPLVYRLLGEVLLRRGDADRAEKVLERAMQLGATDAATRLWLDRARVYKAMQGKLGPRAVAAEVERSEPAASSEIGERVEPASEPTMPVAERDPQALRLDSSDVLDDDPPTSVRLPPVAQRTAAMRPPSGPATAALPVRPGSLPPPPVRRGPPPSLATGDNLVRSAPPAAGRTPDGMPKAAAAFMFDEPLAGPGPGVEESLTFDLAMGPRKDRGAAFESPTTTTRTAAPPKPRELLDALALTGVFERSHDPNAKAEWTKPPRAGSKRGTWLLAVATVLFVGGAAFTYRYVEQQRTMRKAAAEALMAEIENGLLDGRPSRLPDLEKSFAKAFELDSRSPRAALAWARERAMVGVLRGGQDVTFEDATSRARAVGIPDRDLAFTQLASYLFQNDNAGAVSLLAKHDEASKKDPYYELLAGVCLERLGDARARERYSAAVKLAPELVPAQVALIRYEIVEGERGRAAELVAQFRARHQDRPEGVALAALLWARDPSKPKVPPEVVALGSITEALPLTLLAVPHAVAARVALEKPALPEARDAIKKGLAASDGPGVASWLGFLALEAEDDALARKGALTAVAYSALYPRARVLAARVALQGGRLDEALKATEELDASSVDVAVARAVVSYERADADGLARALEALPADRRALPGLSAVTLAQGALAGRADLPAAKIVARATAEDLWSDIVAMDVALNTGNLDAASAIGNRWLAQTSADKVPALRALRLARLARYQARLDDAEALSLLALSGATPTLRSITERAFVLAARGHAADVGPMLGKAGPAAGPLASWLGAFAVATSGKVDEARGRAASLEPAPESSPAPMRIPIAAALGAMKDKKRGGPFVEPLLKQGLMNPDVVTAAQALGLKGAPKAK